MAYPTHGNEYHERQSWKVPCRAATTANITIATDLNAGDVLDGVTLVTGDRVLVKDQTSGQQNGVYVVGATPARAVDFASSPEIVGGAIIVIEGTANAGTAWVCTTPATVTVGTTVLDFTQLGSGGGGGSLDIYDGFVGPYPTTVLRVGGLTDNGGGDIYILPQVTGDGDGALEFQTDTVYLHSNDSQVGLYLDPSGHIVNLWAAHPPGDGVNLGLWLQFGDDYLGLYINEKDSSTIQLHPGGNLDIELLEAGGHHWKFVNDAATAVAIPAMGMLPQFAAAPHSGTETEGESYYSTTTHKSYTWDGTTWQPHW